MIHIIYLLLDTNAYNQIEVHGGFIIDNSTKCQTFYPHPWILKVVSDNKINKDVLLTNTSFESEDVFVKRTSLLILGGFCGGGGRRVCAHTLFWAKFRFLCM